ncbi:acetate/propionate family kinase [Periweissella beninensis]|uniref:acetate/propionate family kinase n=1 Tax=Periweissella beninensis TaxID=504936 RepID=UPI0021A635AF|nr:acetate kinase [Periweissella beninensis]MCT4396244.1 acetate kinase [Periweissella beninensis]
MTKVLALNAGSSSLKMQLMEMPTEKLLCKGQVERIGFNDAIVTVKSADKKIKKIMAIKDHTKAIDILLKALVELAVITDYAEIKGAGHRIVQGGTYFNKSVVIDANVLKKIESLGELAPLHNPVSVIVIKALNAILPDIISVGVFDTAFHQSLAEVAYLYSIPLELSQKYAIRKYGAHGTSHDYVSHRAAEMLDKPYEDLKIITLHLGAGASMTAIKNGKSFDTSMGFTPIAGLTMGTRAGDIDISIITYLAKKLKISAKEVFEILNKKSGLLGLSGISSDSREIEDAMATDDRAKLAMDIFVDRIIGYIGSYYAKMGGVDVLVFTAGIGENSAIVRQMIIDRLSFLGIKLAPELNQVRGVEQVISTDDSTATVLLIPTNEELMIARDTFKII